MTTSLETKGILPANESAAEGDAKGQRSLLWRFLLICALIVVPVGFATFMAYWVE